MKKIGIITVFLVSLLTVSITSCNTTKNRKTTNDRTQDSETNILIISYNDKSVLDNLKKEIKLFGATIVYDYNNFNSVAISIPKNKSTEKAIKHFEKIEGVLGVEKDQKMELQ